MDVMIDFIGVGTINNHSLSSLTYYGGRMIIT